MICFHIARKCRGEVWICVVYDFDHAKQFDPFADAKCYAFLCRPYFDAAIWHVELAEIHALEAAGDRDVVSAAYVLLIFD